MFGKAPVTWHNHIWSSQGCVWAHCYMVASYTKNCNEKKKEEKDIWSAFTSPDIHLKKLDSTLLLMAE